KREGAHATSPQRKQGNSLVLWFPNGVWQPEKNRSGYSLFPDSVQLLAEGADFGLDDRRQFRGKWIGATKPSSRFVVDHVALGEQRPRRFVQAGDLQVATGAGVRLGGAEMPSALVVESYLPPLVGEIGVSGEAWIDLGGGQERIGVPGDDGVQ